MNFSELENRIIALLSEKDAVTICIDGRAASGKSSAAAALAAKFGGAVIHTDDFFLPKEKRTPERIFSPAGGFDIERFESEVLPSLSRHTPFSYGAYNCKNGETERIDVPSLPLRIVEGAYSSHPRLGDIYDLKVFFTIDSTEQKRRISERNGKDGLSIFLDRWIVAEEKYFKAFSIEENCDITITYP